MKQLFAIAVPILPGKTDQWKQFSAELKTTYATQFAESRKQLGVRERTFFQSTPQGDLVLVTLEGEDPVGALTRFGQGTDPFTRWFLAQAKEIHGLDLSGLNEGALPELVVDTMPATVYN